MTYWMLGVFVLVIWVVVSGERQRRIRNRILAELEKHDDWVLGIDLRKSIRERNMALFYVTLERMVDDEMVLTRRENVFWNPHGLHYFMLNQDRIIHDIGHNGTAPARPKPASSPAPPPKH